MRPDTPHIAAGLRIEVAVSVPRAAGTIRAASAAADPPELPPGPRIVSHGFTHGELLVLIANSAVLSFPSSTIPAAARRAHTVAS